MDLLTQGLLGAAMSQSVARQQEVRIATGIGLFAGMIADADILIRSSDDPLLNIEFHRHFTHSIFFVPLGALLVSALLWLLLRRRLSFSRLYVLSFAGYCLSGVLDALTSYGTHLLWPWRDDRVALNIISVLDPAFTVILLLTVALAFNKSAVRIARIGLLLATAYLCLGWIQLQRAEAQAVVLIKERAHTKERLLVRPTLANLVLWRAIYEHEGRLYVDAIRVGIFSAPRVYPGHSIKKFVLEQDLGALPASSVLATDIERFNIFSAGWLGIDPAQPDILVDVRYSNLPDSVEPMWAIKINPERSGDHARFMVTRDVSRQTREKFLGLIMGEHQ
jgi:inner membrane protein